MLVQSLLSPDSFVFAYGWLGDFGTAVRGVRKKSVDLFFRFDIVCEGETWESGSDRRYIRVFSERIEPIRPKPSAVEGEERDFRRRVHLWEPKPVSVEPDRRIEIANAQRYHANLRVHGSLGLVVRQLRSGEKTKFLKFASVRWCVSPRHAPS